MTSLVIVDVAASVGCSCPILVLLRWGRCDAKSESDVVVDDSTNHAKSVDDPIFDLDDDHDDAMIDLNVVAALFLDDVVMCVLL